MLNFITYKPYFLFLVLIPIILIFGFIKPKEALDINIHDTYFVIKHLDLAILLAVLYSLLAIVYFVLVKLNFSLVKWMTVVHVLISIGFVILIWVLFQLIQEAKPGNLEKFMSDISFNEKLNIAIILSIIFVIGVQVLFFINVVYALIKGRD